MLKTGNVPVHNLPSPANAERKSPRAQASETTYTDQDIAVSKQAVEEDDEEAELRKLQAEMAM